MHYSHFELENQMIPMSSPTLPHQIISLVVRHAGSRPRRIVSALRALLRDRFRPVHRAMSSSPIKSVRKNAKALRSLYVDGSLASRVFQAASNAAVEQQARIQKISALIVARLGHVLGVLRACQDALSERLIMIASPGLQPAVVAGFPEKRRPMAIVM
jgi:hypothetical protein